MTMPTETKTPKQTVVEEGTEFKGTLKSSCAVVINGQIDGEVDAPEITVTRSGSVAGSLRATKLRAQGTLSGKVEAGDVFLSGVVRSNTSIKAKRLEVKLGSEQAQIEVTFGECALEVGEVASEAAVAPSPAPAPAKAEAPPLLEASGADGWGRERAGGQHLALVVEAVARHRGQRARHGQIDLALSSRAAARHAQVRPALAARIVRAQPAPVGFP
jgi:cytoskeletal protein CcmA (bactofilin family)